MKVQINGQTQAALESIPGDFDFVMRCVQWALISTTGVLPILLQERPFLFVPSKRKATAFEIFEAMAWSQSLPRKLSEPPAKLTPIWCHQKNIRTFCGFENHHCKFGAGRSWDTGYLNCMAVCVCAHSKRCLALKHGLALLSVSQANEEIMSAAVSRVLSWPKQIKRSPQISQSHIYRSKNKTGEQWILHRRHCRATCKASRRRARKPRVCWAEAIAPKNRCD